jgi:hypothetical protein
MSTLRIQHIAGQDPPQFEVIRLSSDDAKRAPAAAVQPPNTFPVEGRPNSNLIRELRWYLEDFLEYPFHPETDHAEHVLAALENWGRHSWRQWPTRPIRA